MSNWEVLKYRTKRRAGEFLDKLSFYIYREEENDPERNLADYVERMRRCGDN